MSGLYQIIDESNFNEILKLPVAIIYITVDWSGQERISRSIIKEVLNKLDPKEIAIFEIDCSNQDKKYIGDWLTNQSKQLGHMYSNGYGETLLIKNGQVTDYIKYPGDLGIEETKVRIKQWLT